MPVRRCSVRRCRTTLPSSAFPICCAPGSGSSIVIGNRFTQRKRNWIFTPRGYNDWVSPAQATNLNEFPSSAVWVFSGTSDGNALANAIAKRGYPVIVSTATEYGGEVANQHCPGIYVWTGRQGVEGRRGALTRSQARALVDATHPYARQMSEQLISLS